MRTTGHGELGHAVRYLFQSLVGAMRTAEVTAAGLALMRFQSLVGAMRTREEEA